MKDDEYVLTAAELIELLKTVPPDTPVGFVFDHRCCQPTATFARFVPASTHSHDDEDRVLLFSEDEHERIFADRVEELEASGMDYAKAQNQAEAEGEQRDRESKA